MCGRFALGIPRKRLEEAYGCAFPDETRESYNIAPTQFAPVVAARHGARDAAQDGARDRTLCAALMRWGLTPSRAGASAASARLINARSETAARMPAFRAAWRARRCVVPASGFFEWSAPGAGAGKKLPHHIAPADSGLLHMAGLWEADRNDMDVLAYSFCVLTCAAGPDLAWLHHRQPVLLAADALDDWLDERTPEARLAGLCAPSAAGTLRTWRVGLEVNRAGSDGPQLIRPLAEDDGEGALPLLRV